MNYAYVSASAGNASYRGCRFFVESLFDDWGLIFRGK